MNGIKKYQDVLKIRNHYSNWRKNMNMAKLALLAGVFLVSCTPINERVTSLLGKISIAESLIERLEKKDYQRGEESSKVIAQLDSAVAEIRNTLKDASKEVSKNGKQSQAVLDAMEILRNDLTTLVVKEMNVSVEVPSWRLSSAQYNISNIQKNFGEIIGYFSTIYPDNSMKLSAKRFSVSVDRELLDTMPICEQEFRKLGIINALANKVRTVYDEETKTYRTVVEDYRSCVWRGLGNCGHQMNINCLKDQILNNVVLNLLTGDSCDGITYMISNSINSCHSATPVLRSQYNGY